MMKETALAWRARLSVPHGVAWREQSDYYAAMQAAVEDLFAGEGFPDSYAEWELRYERDPLGKPYILWEGRIAEWAQAQGRDCRFLHVSNTHDGGANIVLAAYDVTLAGIGIDAVYLPRLALPDKDAVYLRRFAARFMSAQEQTVFEQASEGDDLSQLRLRVAAHFSLMEAASKACGTGLKVGIGMGRETSLPKQSLGVLRLETDVELLFEGDALARLETLSAQRAEAYWSASETFLISVVLLWK
jgi:phosphopantetheinyl transferase (holo-ACP synthase)